MSVSAIARMKIAGMPDDMLARLRRVLATAIEQATNAALIAKGRDTLAAVDEELASRGAS